MTTEQIITKERCYRCGGELEDGFVTIPGDRDHEDGYQGNDDYLCSRCTPVSMEPGWGEEVAPLSNQQLYNIAVSLASKHPVVSANLRPVQEVELDMGSLAWGPESLKALGSDPEDSQ